MAEAVRIEQLPRKEGRQLVMVLAKRTGGSKANPEEINPAHFRDAPIVPLQAEPYTPASDILRQEPIDAPPPPPPPPDLQGTDGADGLEDKPDRSSTEKCGAVSSNPPNIAPQAPQSPYKPLRHNQHNRPLDAPQGLYRPHRRYDNPYLPRRSHRHHRA